MSVIATPIRRSAIPLRDRFRQSLRALLKDNDKNTQAFDDMELDQFLDLSLSDMNSHPTFTAFTWNTVSPTWQYPICLAAQIMALIAQGLIEKGREFEINDNGIQFVPPRLGDHMASAAAALIGVYTVLKETIKSNIKPSPVCLGTFRVLAINPYLIRSIGRLMWQHMSKHLAVSVDLLTSNAEDNTEGSLRDPVETTRRATHWVEDIVRSAWRHAELGRNDLVTQLVFV